MSGLVDVSVESRAGVAVVSVFGDVDKVSALELAQVMVYAVQDSRPRLLLVDLAGVSLLSSGGVAVLVAAAKDMQRLGGELRVVAAPTSGAVRVLKSVDAASGLLAVFPSKAAALADDEGLPPDAAPVTDQDDSRLPISAPVDRS